MYMPLKICYATEIKAFKSIELFYWSVHRSLTGQNDVVQDGFDLDFFYMTEDVINNHFLFRPLKYRKLMSLWMDFFSDDHFTDDELREHFRVSHDVLAF